MISLRILKKTKKQKNKKKQIKHKIKKNIIIFKNYASSYPILMS